MTFYDQLADLYDVMIDFDRRLTDDQELYRELLADYPAASILDAGCGTGLHSLIFALLGVAVTGIDSSVAMIGRARGNRDRYKLEISFFQSDFQRFPAVVPGPFDAIYCLGNSFVHLKSEAERLLALKNFHQVLIPGGMLCLQILNYDRLLKIRPAVISQKKRPPYRFIRRYDYQPDRIIFTLEISGLPETHTLVQDIFPVGSAEIRELAEASGFGRTDLTGSLSRLVYNPAESVDCCLWAWK